MLSHNLLLAGDDGYNLTRSLRFRSSATAYLNRTNTNSPTNNKICTWSFWFKNSQQSANAWITGTGTAGTSTTEDSLVIISSTQTLYCELSGTATGSFQTTQVFRDPSAWYHIVVAYDTTQATNTNRIKLYVNGVQVTAFSSISYPALNATLNFGGTQPQSIGRRQFSTSNYLDGYLTEINFIDGQAITPTSFGSTNALTGVWQPKKYAGTYGTNGFYLPFTDNSSLANLTADKSGNSNNWTANNISLTAGSTYDSMIDVPTLSALASNYCVLNPLDKGTSGSLTNGNLNWAYSSAAWNGVRSSFIVPKTGKWYWEAYIGGIYADVGLCLASARVNAEGYNDTGSYSYGAANGEYRYSGASQGSVATYTTGDTIAYRVNDGVVSVYKNNSLIATWSQNLSAQSGDYFANVFSILDSTGVAMNFGQRPFAYTPPTGFVALNTFNLPEPSIKAGNKQMDVNLYTGTNATQNIVNSGAMQPDLVWIKARSAAYNHGLVDSVRGINKHLFSNMTNAEGTCTAGKGITALNSNGFTLGTESDTNAPMNENGVTFVAWQWKAGGTAVTNTAGSISAQVSANPTAGFSVVTYTGTGVAATVGHGLGVALSMVIVKRRNSTSNWPSYHKSLGATDGIYLNLTNATTASTLFWNDTAPTSSVFSLGSGSGTNASGGTYVAYCFTPIAGYSAFGSYTGNGSADGPFVFTGFRPRFVMIKNTSAVGSWEIQDTSRAPSNVMNAILQANTSSAEITAGRLDGLSNGFKLRTASDDLNTSGSTYIYMAFAENPFKNALAR